MNNFFFIRPEAEFVHQEFGIMKFFKDETFFKWKKLQHYLFHNYDIPEYYNGKFNFIAYGSPIYGVVDNILQLIPCQNDDRVKPELFYYFVDIWNRMNNTDHSNPIIGYNIDTLYGIFNLDNYEEVECDLKRNRNIITYKNEHTFYKNW